MQDAKSDSLASIAFDSVLLETATSILEQTAIDHAKERVIEELETLSDKIPKPGFGDMAGVMIQNIIQNRIKELRGTE